MRQSLRESGIPFEIKLGQHIKETIGAILEVERFLMFRQFCQLPSPPSARYSKTIDSPALSPGTCRTNLPCPGRSSETNPAFHQKIPCHTTLSGRHPTGRSRKSLPPLNPGTYGFHNSAPAYILPGCLKPHRFRRSLISVQSLPELPVPGRRSPPGPAS